MRLQHGISTSAGPATVQLNHDRLGITAPLYSVVWMVNDINLEMLGSHASRSNPPNGIFYSEPDGPKPTPHIVFRDISAKYHKPELLDTLPVEVLSAMAVYVWIAGDTPGYVNGIRDPTKHALVIYSYRR
jgi:hypothetical protein